MIVNKLTLPAKENAVQLKINEIIDNLISADNLVTTNTDQNITSVKTFVGQKRIGFKQSGSSDKLGFTLYNNSGTEKGYLEYNPSNNVDGVPLMTLGNYATASGGLTHVGFRKYSSISGANGAYNLLTPLISDAKTPFNLTTTYTNFYFPLGFTDGSTTVLTAKSGVVDLSSLLPTVPTNISAFTNDSGYITGITSSDVTTALGYTPYSSANPSGYQSNVIETVKVNGTAQTVTSKAVDISVPTKVSQLTNDSGYTTNVGTVTSVNNVSPVNGNVSLTIPTVNNATLTIQKNGTTVKTFTANASTDVTCNITVPTKTSDLTNDSSFITGITSSMVTTALGYTPYSSANPSGYQANVIETIKVNNVAQTVTSKTVNITVPSAVTESTVSGWGFTKNVGTVTKVNNTSPDSNGNVTLTIPTVNNATLTIQKNGTTVKTFTANASSNVTANITVPTQASDIGAQETLVSGTNIKTVNNTSLLGSGNIDTSEIFVATYGTTSYSDVLTAYNAGKTIICKYLASVIEHIYVLVRYEFDINGDFVFSQSLTASTSYNILNTARLDINNNWSISGIYLADTDLSNLSSTGEAKFVNTTGDTMTGELSIQADSAKIKLSNINLTKGTNPDNTIFYSYQFNDSTNSDTWQNTRLGLLEESVQSNGTTQIALITYRNQAASTEGAALRLSMTSAGVASCTFPNTTCVDSHWVKASKQFFGGRTLSDSSSYLGLDLSDYLPNDSYSYELLLKGYVTTTNTSGAYIYLDIYSTLSDSQRVAEAQTRASATVEGGGSTLIPVSSDRILRVNRNTNFKGSATLYAVAYKRLGTNS